MLELIKDKYKTISIVGMAKNSGKTVALNHLISRRKPPLVLLIGRDGETIDIVTETENLQSS